MQYLLRHTSIALLALTACSPKPEPLPLSPTSERKPAQSAQPDPARVLGGKFIEDDAPFLRSALLAGDVQQPNRARRGVLVRCGSSVWACFDPDLLRWSVIWRTEKLDDSPITSAAMAAVSYPDKQAKASHTPRLVGETLLHTEELPGATRGATPGVDVREGRLSDGRTPVGPMPISIARYEGLVVHGAVTVVEYTIAGTRVREFMTAPTPKRVERTLQLSANKEPIALRLASMHGTVSRTSVRMHEARLPCLTVRGNAVQLHSDSERGTWLLLQPGKARTVQITVADEFQTSHRLSVPDRGAAAFPRGRSLPTTSPVATDAIGPLSVRNLNFPEFATGERIVRPTDIAFLQDGTALLTTFDGDVWRIEGIGKRAATWRRVAAGLFEPTNIEIDDRDQVFVLGRDQITRLIDSDGDHVFDRYENHADGFLQTLNTRDYAMSMAREPAGSFLVAKGGLDAKGNRYPENAPHRGAILRVRLDGSTDVLADGLRLPYVGLRKDGAVFASDQQGNWIPSTPVHQIAAGAPSYGFVPTRHRGGKAVADPLLWFPYQSNRSGAGFVTLDARAFPDLPDRFVHVSWDGRLFVIVTPSEGHAFGWRLPLQFEFPSLNGANHPETGTHYSIGLGISGYLPMTVRLRGLAAVRQSGTMVVPSGFAVTENGVSVWFAKPVPPDTTIAVASLRFWNIRRSKRYGSGHYRWDGNPGEHAFTPLGTELSRDRTQLDLDIGAAYRSSIVALHLQVHPGGDAEDYALELFAMPLHLPVPTAAELAALQVDVPSELDPGDARVGEQLFARHTCAGCHSLQGQKLVGPPLDGVASRHAGQVDEFLRESILDPIKVVTKGYSPSMPSFEGVITPQDVEHLIAYLRGL